MIQPTVLFLCTGNYYRSRFAEQYFQYLSNRENLAWRSSSRGLRLSAGNVGPISPHAIKALTNLGIDMDAEQRMPQPVTDADFAAADWVVAVKEAEHRSLIEASFPQWLNHVEFWQIHDIDCATPEVALPLLQEHVLALSDRLSRISQPMA